MRERTVGEMVAAAEAAGAPVRARRQRRDGRVPSPASPRRWAVWQSTSTRRRRRACSPAARTPVASSTGGYASGLAAALVFGRLAARAALEGRVNHSFGGGEPFTVGARGGAVAGRRREAPARPLGRARDRGDGAPVRARTITRPSWPRSSCAPSRAAARSRRRPTSPRAAPAIRAAGGVPLAVGLHPDAELRRRAAGRHRPLPPRGGRDARADQAHARVRPARARRGCPTAEAAVRAFNGLREALPLIGAIGANSPVLVRHGLGSGERPLGGRARLSRAAASRRRCAAGDEYLETLERHRARRRAERLHAGLVGRPAAAAAGHGRAARAGRADGPRATAGMAALVHALVRRAVEDPVTELAPAQALHWSSFRAVRDGLDAELLFRGELRPAREAARELLDELRGEDDALEAVERILREGGAARRQRKIVRRRRDGRAAARAGRRDRAPLVDARSPAGRTARPAAAMLLGRFAERRDRLVLGEAAERLLLELADALARESEPAAGLAQSLGLLAVQAEAQRQHGALVLRERADCVAQRLPVELGARRSPRSTGRRWRSGRRGRSPRPRRHPGPGWPDRGRRGGCRSPRRPAGRRARRSPRRWAGARARRRACARRPRSCAPARRCGPAAARCGPSWQGRGRSPGGSRACRTSRT